MHRFRWIALICLLLVPPLEAGTRLLNETWEISPADGDRFIVDNKLVEIGGKQKKRKKADFVIRDDTERPIGNGIPLWSLGMIY